MASERFEMRIDSELLERLDAWRLDEDDQPSRAEAVRRLLEGGLAHDNKGKAPTLTDGEKLISVMLASLIEKTNVNIETDVSFVQKVILGGHYWALGWEMPSIFHGHADKQSRVRRVVDILDMWNFLEEAYDGLETDFDKEHLATAAHPFGSNVRFSGFDGNNEAEYLSIARFLIDDMSRFERFKGRQLNAHRETLVGYERMLAAFEPIRKTLSFRRMNVDQLIAVLNARRHTD